MEQILDHQIFRLAKIYISREVCVENIKWHNRVANLQAECIRAKKGLKK